MISLHFAIQAANSNMLTVITARDSTYFSSAVRFWSPMMVIVQTVITAVVYITLSIHAITRTLDSITLLVQSGIVHLYTRLSHYILLPLKVY